jgi:hypothetical protein
MGSPEVSQTQRHAKSKQRLDGTSDTKGADTALQRKTTEDALGWVI